MHENDLSFLNEGREHLQAIPKVYWLKNYYSDIWEISKGKKIITFSWVVVLSDNTVLTDSENAKLLDVCRRLLIEFKNSSSIDRMLLNGLQLLNIVDWLLLNSDRYEPKEYAFSKLDSDSIRSLVRDFIWGGVDTLRGAIPRIERIFKQVLSSRNSQKIIKKNFEKVPIELRTLDATESFNKQEVQNIVAWMYLNGWYERHRDRSRVENNYSLNLMKIKDAIRYDRCTCKQYTITNFSAATKLYLRNFEHIIDSEKFDLLTSYSSYQRLPDDYKSLEELAETPKTEGSARQVIDILNSFKSLTGSIWGLPNSNVLNDINFNKLALRLGAIKGTHHRTTPPEIALTLLDSSIGFILKYGYGIVETSLKWKEIESNIRAQCNGYKTDWSLKKARLKVFKELTIPEELVDLNITRQVSYWSSVRIERDEHGGHTGGKLSRDEMTLEDALIFLYASVFIVLASLSARRKSELLSLKRGCVVGSDESYYLKLHLGKSNFEDKRTEIIRPIPNVAARAISLLERFKDGFEKYTNKRNDYLFAVPYSLQGYSNSGSIDAKTIKKIICRFCDYQAIGDMPNNRRWYPKNHEFRRFFAIVFFWQYKFSNLAAISWMLGHIDASHTYAYIQEIVGGTEMRREEARFTAEAMLQHEPDDTLDTLRKLVRRHFHCDDVALVERAELELFIESLIEDELFIVRPHSLITSEGERFEIVFEITEDQ